MSTIDNTIGTILMCLWISLFAYGVFTFQTMLYFTNTRGEPFVKVLVGVVWVLETVQSVLAMWTVYLITVTHRGHLEFLGVIVWQEPTMMLVGIVIVILVHCYFVRRFWILFSRIRLLALVVACFAFAHAFFGLSSSSVYKYDDWVAFWSVRFTHVFIVGGLSSAAVTDVLIACSLTVYLLFHQEGISGQLNTVLNRLIRFIIGTGALTAVTSLLFVIAFVTDQSGLYLGIGMLQCKVYANSLLVNLNLRGGMRARLQRDPDDVVVPGSRTRASGIGGRIVSRVLESLSVWEAARHTGERSRDGHANARNPVDVSTPR